jgi:alginate O-acetyltransferase complex protein AlgI
MVFTSWQFAVFLLVVLAALRIAPSRTTRQTVLLLASIYFYAAWRPAYILLLAAPSVIDYGCAILISETSDRTAQRRILWASVVSNMGLLAYFKYTNFFLSTITALLGVSHRTLDITLPVGISFFTFKALSYTIDVYRKEIPVCRNWRQFAMFITYFPELIAGPIVRASVFLPQLQRSLRFSWARTYLGAQLILLGATKKLVIADRLAILVDAVFADPSAYSPVTVLSSVIAYSFQIYCDFSGYSDMAIGVSKIIGYDLPENFNMPYLALSLSDFWRRWHITLSSWLRDYLYIPLGGNRKGSFRTYVNMMITMLLGGLWHGANWTFVFWGLLHGLGIAVAQASSRRFRLPRIVAWLLTYAFVCLTWIFFRSPSLSVAIIILKKVLWLDRGGALFIYSPLLMLLPVLILGHLLGKFAETQARNSCDSRIHPPRNLELLYGGRETRFAVRPHPLAGIYILLPTRSFAVGFVATMWLVALFLFASLNTSPFIYFQF